jgi:hypothetical protein
LTPPAYAFGRVVHLFEQADFLLFVAAVSKGLVRYDPALKIEASSSRQPRMKKRNQFRAKHADLSALYNFGEVIDVVSGSPVRS